MKYSFLKKRIYYILFFCFSTLGAQKILLINNTDYSIIVKNGKKEITINRNEKKELFDTKDGLALSNVNNLNRFIKMFLEPTEKLSISIEKDNTFIYNGDKASIHEYINEKLNIETFGKIKKYATAYEKKNIGELKIISEFLLLDILKNIKQLSILPSENDTNSIIKMKKYAKYNWIFTILSTVNGVGKDKSIKKEAINYYYKKYIEADIAHYNCEGFFPYSVLEILAKSNSLLQISLPVYPIIENTDQDNINQFLPKDCQKFYFLGKYQYLEHINNPEKEYYKKVLDEKFND